jgi:hypothetical protein
MLSHGTVLRGIEKTMKIQRLTVDKHGEEIADDQLSNGEKACWRWSAIWPDACR